MVKLFTGHLTVNAGVCCHKVVSEICSNKLNTWTEQT